MVLGEDAVVLERTEWAQPALFAFEVALFRLLESWGVRPDTVAGHSVGEIAAAHVAGVFSLEDACRLVAARGRLMQALPSGGAMLSVRVSEQEALDELADRPEVGLAAVNGPRSVVLAGPREDLEPLALAWAAPQYRATWLSVSHAFHSPLIDPVLDELHAVVAELDLRTPELNLVSTVTGSRITDEICDPAYWVRHARQTVRFADAVRTLREQGATWFVEVGPGGALAASTRLVIEDESSSGRRSLVTPLLRREVGEVEAVLTGVANLWTAGVPVRWSSFYPGITADWGQLPTYPFQHRRYWPEPAAAKADPRDAAFWDAVEQTDAPAVAELVGLPAEALQDVLPALSSWRRERDQVQAAQEWCHAWRWSALPTPTMATPAGKWLVVGRDGDADVPVPAGAVRVELGSLTEQMGITLTRLVCCCCRALPTQARC